MVETIAAALGKCAPRLRMPAAPPGLVAAVVSRLRRGSLLTRSRLIALSGRSRSPIDKIRAEPGYEHLVRMEEGFRELEEAWKSATR